MPQKYLTPTIAVFLLLATTLGTSPIVMPSAFIKGGFGLSILIFSLMCLFCLKGWENLVELLSICNAITNL